MEVLFELYKAIISTTKAFCQWLHDRVTLSIAVKCATKKPLARFVYGPIGDMDLADDEGVVGVKFTYGDSSVVMVPRLFGVDSDEEYDSCFRAEMRRMRRAAKALGIEVVAVVADVNGNVLMERA